VCAAAAVYGGVPGISGSRSNRGRSGRMERGDMRGIRETEHESPGSWLSVLESGADNKRTTGRGTNVASQ